MIRISTARESRLHRWFKRLGLVLFGLVFVLSCVMVFVNHGGAAALSPDVHELTFAHWQLEDGFREGFDRAIAEYEQIKARQGIKVKIHQVAVPVRGYPQWQLTQLIGGDPADVMEIACSSQLQNRYFVPLSQYIDRPNHWNAGTSLEKYSWRESFNDDLLSSFDMAYCDYFGVCIFSHTIRLYINMELFRNACGANAAPPETVTEWLNACAKIEQYGKRVGRPMIPIGVRGFDKGTLSMLLVNYFSQLNADLPELCSRYGDGSIYSADLFGRLRRGKLDPRRLFAAYAMIAGLGRYFAPGFASIDLEQTKYLFSSGNVAFFIDGTYNAWSMVNNAPFEVEIARLPALDRELRLGNDSIGLTAEGLAGDSGGKFGIAKASREFDLALDFLQYITSYRVNRMTMVDYCKWMSPLKQVAYSGMMEKIQPVTGAEYPAISVPFHQGAYSTHKSLQWLESCIINHEPDTAEFMRSEFMADRENMIYEISENALSCQRTIWDLAATASAMRTGMLVKSDPETRRRLAGRADIAAEATVAMYRSRQAHLDAAAELAKNPEEP